MSHTLGYAEERATRAVEALATGTSSIQQRVAAALRNLTMIDRQVVPKGRAAEAFDQIKRQEASALKRDPQIEKACSLLSDVEARELSLSIFAFHVVLKLPDGGYVDAP